MFSFLFYGPALLTLQVASRTSDLEKKLISIQREPLPPRVLAVRKGGEWEAKVCYPRGGGGKRRYRNLLAVILSPARRT